MGLVQRESIMFLQWPRMDKPNTGSRAVALKIFMTPLSKNRSPLGASTSLRFDTFIYKFHER